MKLEYIWGNEKVIGSTFKWTVKSSIVNDDACEGALTCHIYRLKRGWPFVHLYRMLMLNVLC